MIDTSGDGDWGARHTGRSRTLALLALTLVLSMSTWFSATAVISQLDAQWELSSSAAAWLTIAVQVGFVCGALLSSLLNLSDVVSPLTGSLPRQPAGTRCLASTRQPLWTRTAAIGRCPVIE